MAESKKNTASNASENTVQIETDDQKYTLESLRQHCLKLFGCTTSTFDGAMHGVDKESMTVDEAKCIINTWLYGKGGKA